MSIYISSLFFAGSSRLPEYKNEIEEIRDYLLEVKATDAAKATEKVLELIERFELVTQVRIDALQKVWEAVERNYHNDITNDQVQETIEEWRTTLED